MCLNTNLQLKFVFDWRNESNAMKSTTQPPIHWVSSHTFLCGRHCCSLANQRVVLLALLCLSFAPIIFTHIPPLLASSCVIYLKWAFVYFFFRGFCDNFKYKNCFDLNHLLTNIIYFLPRSFAPNFGLNGFPYSSKSIWQRRIQDDSKCDTYFTHLSVLNDTNG